MPLFKVTVSEQTTRTMTAYVEAADQGAADDWASKVADFDAVAHEVDEDNDYGQVERIESVTQAPDRARIHTAQ